ncbi:MAG: glycosyltransferase family 2 protein [Sulfitobacter sp.]
MPTDAATQNLDHMVNPLIVIPCLNEAGHIRQVLQQLLPSVTQIGGRIVVVDGGSTDGTLDIVEEFARVEGRISILHNPQKLQSAGINLAVEQDNGAATYLIRVDAHCSYPSDFCARLLEEAANVDAASVVVSMIATGDSVIQKINAAAQNSPLGNGGSKHRMSPRGQYVDHGHHALIHIDAFKAVGGYDSTFSHNEDAELDFRLHQAGHKIWLTASTVVKYFPRTSFQGLARQYANHGRGRARNMLKHRVIPRLRQTKVMMVLPMVLLAVFSAFNPIAAFPAALWIIYCLVGGARLAIAHKKPQLIATAFSAMVMHLSWSFGFWAQIAKNLRSTAVPSQTRKTS